MKNQWQHWYWPSALCIATSISILHSPTSDYLICVWPHQSKCSMEWSMFGFSLLGRENTTIALHWCFVSKGLSGQFSQVLFQEFPTLCAKFVFSSTQLFPSTTKFSKETLWEQCMMCIGQYLTATMVQCTNRRWWACVFSPVVTTWTIVWDAAVFIDKLLFITSKLNFFCSSKSRRNTSQNSGCWCWVMKIWTKLLKKFSRGSLSLTFIVLCWLWWEGKLYRALFLVDFSTHHMKWDTPK